jgi:hypothetical protein
VVQVPRVEPHEEDIGEGVLQHGAAMVERRYSLDDVPIEITIVVLREVKEVSRPVVVDGDVDSWQLV